MAMSEGLTQAQVLAQMNVPDFPVPMGVFYQIEKPTYDDSVHHQVDSVIQKKGDGDLNALLRGNAHWDVD